MEKRLQSLKQEVESIINGVSTLQEIDDIRVKYLGKKGSLTEISKQMRDISPDDRPRFGQLVNETKTAITELIEKRMERLKEQIKEQQLKDEIIDISLPGRMISTGWLHPITETMDFLKDIFIEMGFDVAEANDGEDGLRKLDKLYENYGETLGKQLKIIISDVEMPQMDGFHFAAKVKEDPRFSKIPIIFSSSISDKFSESRGKEAGAESYLVKFDGNKFHEEVSRVVNKYNQELENA